MFKVPSKKRLFSVNLWEHRDMKKDCMLRFSAKQKKSGVLFILKLVVKEQKIKLKVNKLQSCTNQQHTGSRNTKKSRE